MGLEIRELMEYRRAEVSDNDVRMLLDAGVCPQSDEEPFPRFSRQMSAALLDQKIKVLETCKRVLLYGPVCGTCLDPRACCQDCTQSGHFLPLKGTTIGEVSGS